MGKLLLFSSTHTFLTLIVNFPLYKGVSFHECCRDALVQVDEAFPEGDWTIAPGQYENWEQDYMRFMIIEAQRESMSPDHDGSRN